MRTENSIKNAISVIIPYFIIGILGFVKSKVFVTQFSDDIYSLNQLFFQIIGYFSLAEAGFETFIMQKYYDAFSRNDRNEVNKIFTTSVLHFRGLGIAILGAALIAMFFVKYLTKAVISTSYLMTIFMLFVVKNTIDYFMMCPRIVINSDQKAYKTNLYVNGIRILENASDIILALIGVDYLIILIPGIIIRIVFNIIINNEVYKEYPWLNRKKLKYYKHLVKGMSNLIYQRIAGILNSNTDIILISTFVNPVSVIIYTSYNYITKFINDIIYMIANSITPSFANLINEKNSEKSYEVFNEISILFNFAATFFSIVLFQVLDSFIVIWMGNKYTISNIGLILFILIMFDSIIRRILSMVVNSLGLYRETKRYVILEAIVNLFISIALVNKFGVVGVLLGSLLAVYLTSGWYTPYLIYKSIFNKSPMLFVRNYIASVSLVIIISLIEKFLFAFPTDSLLYWLLGATMYSAFTGILLFVIFYFSSKSFKNIVKRMWLTVLVHFKRR